jgi:ribosomal protein S18 acetylase RimI-like enzyme
MERVFRCTARGDLAEVTALYKKAVRRLQRCGIDQWDAEYPDRRILAEDIEKRQMFVVTFDGRIVSGIVMNTSEPEGYGAADWTDREGRFAVIHRLCIHPDFQGLGIGKLTLRAAENHLRDMGCTSVRLDAFLLNPAALGLYAGTGYSRRGTAVFRKGEFALFEKLL